MKKILIADDHEMFRDGIASLLNSIKLWEISGKVSNGLEVIEFLNKKLVDIVILDINMPEMDGIETAAIIRQNFPAVKVLMLSMFNDLTHIQKVIKTGAHGYLLKDSGKKELVEGITTILEGGTYFVDEVKDALIIGFRSEEKFVEVKLTDRETDILQLICQALTTQQIAEQLKLSVHTVEHYRKNLLTKTGAKNSVGILKFAMENKLFQG